MSIPREDCESLGCCMKESLSSSTPRSGDVEEDEELDRLDMRCSRRERDILPVLWWEDARELARWEGCSWLVRGEAVVLLRIHRRLGQHSGATSWRGVGSREGRNPAREAVFPSVQFLQHEVGSAC